MLADTVSAERPRTSGEEAQRGSVEIRRARLTEADRLALIELYRELLAAVSTHGMDVAPTENNARLYYDLFFVHAIRDGDPILLAFVDGALAGGIFWPVNRGPFESNQPHAIGMGVYVRSEFSRRGIASSLRNQARSILKAKGIPSVLGMVFDSNVAGTRSASHDGFRRYGQLLSLDV